MDNKPVIKWHAQELYKLLIENPNDPITAPIAVELETIFFNSYPYKTIEAQPPKRKEK